MAIFFMQMIKDRKMVHDTLAHIHRRVGGEAPVPTRPLPLSRLCSLLGGLSRLLDCFKFTATNDDQSPSTASQLSV